MTLDDLEKIYNKAASDVAFLQYEGPNHRAGIRAVVEALRDACYGCEHHLLWDEILASDGEVKAKVTDIGGAFEGLMDGLAKACTPAAAPDVCEWTSLALDPMGYSWMRAACNSFESHERGLINQTPPYKCPSCGKPISFKDAAR